MVVDPDKFLNTEDEPIEEETTEVTQLLPDPTLEPENRFVVL